MRPVRGKGFIAVLAAGGLTLAVAACGDAPAETPGAGSSTVATGPAYHACMVTDTGGIDDRSFNAAAWAGIQAATTTHPNVTTEYVASTTPDDYEPNLRLYVTKKCSFILAVGGLMGDATKKVATENPKQQFGIVDSKLTPTNVFPMQFSTEQAAFLAGYLAAGYSKSGKVGTYGGMKIPPVTIFMDGFADGVAHYNKVKSKNVQLLGWNKAKQNGSFTEDFVSQAKGKSITNTLVSQGADVIMPVAGRTGLGTTDVARTAGGKFAVIWVDQDGCNSSPQDCPVFLTTVVKNISGAVQQAVSEGAGGTPLAAGTGYVGTLANDGVSLAPYHEFDGKVDAGLKAEVEKLKADIIAGTITVTSASAPK